MNQTTHNKIVSFIWGIADDVLRDLFKRGKYPDVILPMCVLRRMDAVLEPTKQAVLDTKAMLDKAGITEQRAALASAAGHPFYNGRIERAIRAKRKLIGLLNEQKQAIIHQAVTGGRWSVVGSQRSE